MFLPNVPGATLIPGSMSIPESRVNTNLTFQSKPSSSTHQDEPLQKKISSDVDKEKLDEKSAGFEYSGKNIDALLNQALAGRQRILGQSAHRSR